MRLTYPIICSSSASFARTLPFPTFTLLPSGRDYFCKYFLTLNNTFSNDSAITLVIIFLTKSALIIRSSRCYIRVSVHLSQHWLNTFRKFWHLSFLMSAFWRGGYFSSFYIDHLHDNITIIFNVL